MITLFQRDLLGYVFDTLRESTLRNNVYSVIYQRLNIALVANKGNVSISFVFDDNWKKELQFFIEKEYAHWLCDIDCDGAPEDFEDALIIFYSQDITKLLSKTELVTIDV